MSSEFTDLQVQFDQLHGEKKFDLHGITHGNAYKLTFHTNIPIRMIKKWYGLFQKGFNICPC